MQKFIITRMYVLCENYSAACVEDSVSGNGTAYGVDLLVIVDRVSLVSNLAVHQLLYGGRIYFSKPQSTDTFLTFQ